MRPTKGDDQGKLQEDSEAPFTAGSYVCEIYLDGRQQGRAAFNIDFAPCPSVSIQQQTPCVGFYRKGTECPAGGATGAPDPKCACSDRGWECNQ